MNDDRWDGIGEKGGLESCSTFQSLLYQHK